MDHLPSWAKKTCHVRYLGNPLGTGACEEPPFSFREADLQYTELIRQGTDRSYTSSMKL
jgi:hypothetical protein